ncbi:MAG: acyltransferase [Muribaculaceae bacterium]|nr:acyltransferase [Muribaculaceae bacterium]
MKIFKILISAPRSIIFNLRYLPFKQAIKLPIWLAGNVRIRNMWRGGIELKNPRFNAIHIGYHEADAVDNYGTHTILSISKGSKLIFSDDAHIGRGAILRVKHGARLMLGRNFAISGTTSIVCSHQIEIGDDVQFSWNSLVMDSDAHKVLEEDGRLMNPARPVTIGNKVWIASNCSILKGAKIGCNCVVAGNSLVNKDIPGDNQVIAGSPAKPVKRISGWEL